MFYTMHKNQAQRYPFMASRSNLTLCWVLHLFTDLCEWKQTENLTDFSCKGAKVFKDPAEVF